MKKLTKKLLLSAITLGLALVTLTTTTFAWYTSSTTASATGGSETSGTTEDTTLLISSDYLTAGEKAVWGKSVTFDDLDSSLIPVQWDTTKQKFTYLNDDDAQTTDYYQFTISFKTTKTYKSGATSIPVYLKSLVITNETETLASHDNLLGTSSGVDGIPTKSEYKVNAVRALDLLIDNGTTKTAYELSNTQSIDTDLEFGLPAEADALNYYNAVTFEDSKNYLSRTESLANINLSSQKITEITVTSSSYQVVTVTFTIYLNGWDKYCFDACKGQDFSLKMSFSTVQ